MQFVNVNAIFDDKSQETGQIACNTWTILYGIHIPAEIAITLTEQKKQKTEEIEEEKQ